MSSDEDPKRTVWLNGGFISEVDARVSPLDRGFLYGDGLFETMRAENGRVIRLARHLERLRAGLDALRIGLQGVHEDTWAQITTALLLKNDLGRGAASVKVVVSRGIASGLGFPEAPGPTVLARAEAYMPPSHRMYRDGWKLHATAGGLPDAIARHKTLSYVRLLAARQQALDAGADEALLVDPDGLIIETAAGSVLALTRDGWVRPEHRGQLAGITVEAASRLLEDRGQPVVSRPLRLAELASARAAWVLNSLMGIMPVRSIDDTPMPETSCDVAAELRRELFRTENTGR